MSVLRFSRIPRGILVFTIAAMFAATAFAGEGFIHRRRHPVANRYLVSIPTALDTPGTAAALAERYGGQLDRVWPVLQAFSIDVDERGALAMSADPRVSRVEEDAHVYFSADAQPTDRDPACPGSGCPEADWGTKDNRLWHLDRIDQDTPLLDKTYNYCASGQGVYVYVVDFGVSRDHREFGDTPGERAQRVRDGYDASGENRATRPCNGFVAADVTLYDGTVRRSGHGTSVASLVAGKNLGVAKEAIIVPVKITGCSGQRSWGSNRAFRAGEYATMNGDTFRAVHDGVTGTSVPTTQNLTIVVDGTLTWERVPGAPAFTSRIIDGLAWMMTDIPSKPHAIASLSTFDGVPPPVGSTEPASCDRPGLDTIEGLFLDAIERLQAAGVTIVASANNQKEEACKTIPPLASLSSPVITAGGSMLLNDPDGDFFGGAGRVADQATGHLEGKGPVPVPGPARDALWVCGDGDSTNCLDGAFDSRTLGSNFGAAVTVVAPAKNVTTAQIRGPYDYRNRLLAGELASGTSFAAPITAGVVARMLSMPGASSFGPQEVRDTLVNTAVENMLDPSSLPAGTPNLMLRATDVMFHRQPASVEGDRNADVVLTVSVVAPGPVQYQWYEGADRSSPASATPVGTDSPSLTVKADRSRYYFVRVTGTCTANPSVPVVNTSRVARVGVKGNLAFASSQRRPTASPSLRVALAPGPVILQAPAINCTPSVTPPVNCGNVSYNWYAGERGQVAVPVGSGVQISVTPSATTKYWVRASVADGNDLDSDPVRVEVRIAGAFRVEESRVPIGTSARFTIEGDLAGLSLTWKLDGNPFTWKSGNTTASCASTTCRPEVKLASHTVEVFHGATRLGGATIIGCTPFSSSVSVSDGALTATAPGTNLTYQWYEGPEAGIGRKIDHATAATYRPPAASYARTFWVRVNNNDCYSDAAGTLVPSQRGTNIPAGDGFFSPRIFSENEELIAFIAEHENIAPQTRFQWFAKQSSDTTASCNASARTGGVAVGTDNWALVLRKPLTFNTFWVRVSPKNNPSEFVESCTLFVAPPPAPPCVTTLVPPAAEVSAKAQQFTFQVNRSASCGPWTATGSPTSFAKVVEHGVTRNGSGPVTLDIVQNAKLSTREATIDVAGQVFRLKQRPACPIAITPRIANYAAQGGDALIQVSADASCSWTVTTAENWIRIVAADGSLVTSASHSGFGVIKLFVYPNTGNRRSGSVTVGEQTMAVNQFGAPANMPECASIKKQPFGLTSIHDRNAVVLFTESDRVDAIFRWTEVLSNGSQVVGSLDQLVINPDDTEYPNVPAGGSTTRTYFVDVSRPDPEVRRERGHLVFWDQDPCRDRSDYVTVTIRSSNSCPPPRFTQQPPTLLSPNPGTPIQLTSAAEGNGELPSYRWYRGLPPDESRPIDDEFGGDKPTIFVTPAGPTSYWVKATNSCGSTMSAAARIVLRGGPGKPYAVRHDANSDGRSDQFFKKSSGENQVWLMDSAQHIGTAPLPSSPAGAELQSLGDLNGDGRVDLIWRNPDTGANSVSIMNTTFETFRAPLQSQPDPNWYVAAAADFNDDDDEDLVWHNRATQQTLVWLMDGLTQTGSWSLPFTPTQHWKLQGQGEFNRDGKGDLFFRNERTGANVVWLMEDLSLIENESTMSLRTHAEDEEDDGMPGVQLPAMPDPNWQLLSLQDLNGDKSSEITWYNVATGATEVWFMNGTTVSATFPGDTQTDLEWQPAGTGTSRPVPPSTSTPASLSVTATPATFGGSTTLEATLTANGTPLASQPIAFTIEGSSAGSRMTDSAGHATITVALTGLAAGDHAVSASFAGDATYAASSASATLTIARAAAHITWSMPASIVYGTPLGSAQLNATANVPGTFVYTPSAGTILNAGTHTLLAMFQPTDAANYGGASATVTLTVLTAPVSLQWPQLQPIVYGTPLGSAQLNATANVPGTFVYTPSAGTILDAGAAQTLRVVFTPIDTTNYESTTRTTTINVNKAPQTIQWSSPAEIVYGTALDAQLNATISVSGSSPAGALTYSPPRGTILPAGSHTLTSTAAETSNYNSATAQVTLTVRKATPVISWANPADIVYGTALSSAQLNATANVDGTFTYTPAAGTILDAGTHTLAVSFAPNEATNYESASRTVILNVTKAAQTMQWPSPAAIVYGTPLGDAQLNATVSVSGPSPAGTLTYAPPRGTVLPAGSHTLTATASETANYNAASAQVTLTVRKATPVISWATPSDIVYGTALSSAHLNATANVDGTFTYTPAAGTILDAGTHTLAVSFTPNEATNYESASRTVIFNVMRAAQTLQWPSPAAIVYGTPLGDAQLNATVSVSGPSPAGALTYAPPRGTILPAGSHTLTATAAETSNYNSATAQVTLTVRKATPVISWANPADIVYGTALSSAQLNATANVDGTFTYTPAAGTILDAGTHTLAVSFTPQDSANYESQNAAASLIVKKAAQEIHWTASAPIGYGTPLGATQLNAAVTVPGPSPAGALTYAPSAGRVLDAGVHTLSVSAAETANYLPAASSTTIEVRRVPLTVRAANAAKLYGAPLPPLSGAITGIVNGDAISAVYETTATQASAVGSYVIRPRLIDPQSRLANYVVTLNDGTLVVAPAPLTIRAHDLAKQYSDPLPPLTVTYTGLVLGESPAVLGGSLSLTTTATPNSAPGAYPITAGGVTSANYAIVFVAGTLTVSAEDARVVFTAPRIVSTLNESSTSAKVILAATVHDISATAAAAGDTAPGDIRNATLRFVDRATGLTLCTAPLALVDPADSRTASATCIWMTSLDPSSAPTIGSMVGGYYTRNDAADDVTLTVSAAASKSSVTGGGWIAASGSAGAYAADKGSKMHFTLNASYKGALRGNISVTFTRTSGGMVRSYRARATSLNSLALATNRASFALAGLATLEDVTDSDAPVVIATDIPLIVTATPAADNKPDFLALTLWNPAGGLWFTTGWNGSQPVEEALGGGSTQVH